MQKEISKKLLNWIKVLYIIGSYFLIDALLRILTRRLGYYSIYKPAPSLFSFFWIILIVIFISFFRKQTERILYGISYFLFGFYSVAQFIYYLIFNRFIFITDILLASEGMDYAVFVKDLLNSTIVIQTGIIVITGLIGLFIFPEFRKGKKSVYLRVGGAVLAAAGIAITPVLYRFDSNTIQDAHYEYETFTSSGFDMEIAGFYHYLARDFWMTFLKPKNSSVELKETINSFFSQKPEHQPNEMTGFLKGKNVIIVQLETIDDWMVSEKDTPNIYRLMNEGINFTGMYTPCYGTGWSFGTEFAFNTGVYQGAAVFSGERLARNHFPLSMGNIARSAGYYCNSLHQNYGSYYSRSSMHNVLGYLYHSSRDYLSSDDFCLDDTTLFENDECWRALTEQKPFFGFVITMSAHLPYDGEDKTVKYALAKYPEYDNTSDETNNLRLKARLTDDMFAVLLKRLREDNLLSNTVIIAFDDHYSYGLTDKKLLASLSEQAGDTLLERTPAFIWYEGCEHQEIYKTIQTIDWLPTIANMLDININDHLLGNDIFDDNYKGFAIFPDNTWKYDDCYVKSGNIITQGSLESNEINQKKEFVKEFYTVNQAILETDYYTDLKLKE